MTDHVHAYGPTGSGTVLLDLGGDTGALIIYTGRQLLGREIEISPLGEDDRPRTHAAVRERPVQDGTFHSAVYPDLPAGLYTVWWDETQPAGAVTVTGGGVAEFVWPTSDSPPTD
ncbi:phospholipase [Micromonospora fiedleri]|uniref:Phospholipase n=1 Tax=Micromonospora fiedleri TaxID=1157498 RepID=A0ABS1UG36_9ACTN|nr:MULTISPECIES: phospholipase [Micromonospora]MBL6275293.1 phospholipase [Micromonospora fiedleri]WSK44035.1 phospholipase [Micromonospora maris]